MKVEEQSKREPVTVVVTMPSVLLEKLGVKEMTIWMVERSPEAVISTSWGTIRQLPEGIEL